MSKEFIKHFTITEDHAYILVNWKEIESWYKLPFYKKWFIKKPIKELKRLSHEPSGTVWHEPHQGGSHTTFSNKIRNIKSRNFWFNYRTGAVDYTSESRPSSNWRWIECLSYPFNTQAEIDRLNSDSDIIFKLYETEEEKIRWGLKHGIEKNRLIGYAVKRNEETNNFDSLYF